MISTEQAATILGISQRRVIALISNGALEAQQVGHVWAVDEGSVQARMEEPLLRGRPRADGIRSSDTTSYTLMNRDHEVARFVYAPERRTVVALTPLDDTRWSPCGISTPQGRPNANLMSGWLSERYIPAARPNLARVLSELGLHHQSELLFASLGLNLSDQYWFRPEGTTVSWSEVNYFTNSYVDRYDRSIFTGDPLRHRPQNPSSATPGVQEKWWEKRDGRNYLVKAGYIFDKEPYAELLACRLASRILPEGDFVPYALEEHDKRPYSVCPDFIDEHTEFVTMRDILARYGGQRSAESRRTAGQHHSAGLYDIYVDTCEKLGMDDARRKVDEQIVLDWLTGNTDRHDQNLGVIRDVESLAFVDVAPIFDNGRAFYFDAREPSELKAGLYRHLSAPFVDQPLRQLSLVGDLSWYDRDALRGFEDIVVQTMRGNPLLPAGMPEAMAEQFSLRVQRLNEYADGL